MNGTETGAVTGSHVLVESLDGIGAAHLAELLVHVVGTGARVVADPDTEVLDLQGALLIDLNNQKSARFFVLRYPVPTYHVQGNDLAVRLLELTELSHEVPETRLGHNGVGRKDAHAVQLGRGVRLVGQVTPDDLVLSKTPWKSVSHCSKKIFQSPEYSFLEIERCAMSFGENPRRPLAICGC